jgi:hypothetical protein
MVTKENNNATQNKFSTFSGVFVPSVLAILGAVMYYIAPKVVGGVGLLQMFGIILLAHSITIATAFSISSIATNIQVKGGRIILFNIKKSRSGIWGEHRDSVIFSSNCGI